MKLFAQRKAYAPSEHNNQILFECLILNSIDLLGFCQMYNTHFQV